MAAPKLRFKDFDQDWTGLKIKDLVKSLDAGVSVNSEDVEPQEYEYSVLKTSCISSGYFDENERKRVLQDGEIQRLKEPVLDDSILMSRMNTPLLVGMNAYVFKAPKNTFLPDRLWQLKIDNNKTVTRWLAFYLGSDQGLNQIRDLASGTSNSMKNITKPDVLNIDLFAPQKEEQTKIVAFLSAVDEKISQLTQKHELLGQYKQGMMQKLFSQQIRFKADDGSEFGEWEDKTIEQIANFRRGSFPQPYGLPEWLDSNGFPFVQVYDVSDKMLLKERTKIKISQLAADQSVFAKQGTLIITIQGSIGRIAKMQYDAYVDRTLLIFQSYNYEVDVDYFKYALFLLFNIEKERAEGAIIKTITKETLSKFIVQLPCLEEQTKIANFLSAIDQKIEVVAQQIEQAKQWKKGLLQQMFV